MQKTSLFQFLRRYNKNNKSIFYDREKIDAMNIQEIETGLKQKSEEFKAQGSKVNKEV